MAAVALVLRTSWAGEQICATAAGVLTRLAGARVELDRCEIEPLGQVLVVEGIRVSTGASERPLFAARRLLVDLAPLVFGRSLSLERVELEGPVVDLVVPPSQGADEADGDGPDDGCLDLLQRFEIEKLRIRDASAHVLLPDGAAATVDALDLEVDRVRRAYEARLDLRHAAFASGGTRVPVESLEAQVRLDPAAERLDVDSVRLAGAGAGVAVHGSISRLCNPTVALQATVNVAFPALAGVFVPAMENVVGEATVQAAVSGPAAAPSIDARARVEDLAFDEFELGEVELEAALEGRTLTLKRLAWPVGQGRAIVRGEVELEGDLPARVDVVTEKLPFEALLAKLPIKNTPVQMRIDSEHHLEGRIGGAGLLLEGNSLLSIHDFRVRNEPWHVEKGRTIVEIGSTATLDTRVRLTAEGITLDNARAHYGPGTQLAINARLGFSEASGMTIRTRAPHFDLAHLRSHVAGIPLGGAGEISAVIDGPYSEPLIEGEVDFQQARLFSAQLGHLRTRARSLPSDGILEFVGASATRGSTTLDADVRLVLGGDPTIDATATVREGGRLGDIFDATAGLVAPLEWLRDNVDGTVVTARAAVKGELPRISAEGEFATRNATVMDRPFDTLAAKLHVPDITRLVLDEVRVTRGKGSAAGGGVIRFPAGETPSVDTTVEGRGLPLRDLLGSFGAWAELEGGVGVRGHIRGPIDALDVGGELYAEKVAAKGVKLKATRLSLETQGDQVIVRGPVAGAGNVSGAVRLADGLPFEATLHLDVTELDRFLPKGTGIGGAVRGSATATGRLADVTAAKGTVDLERLALLLADYRLSSEGRTTLRFDAGAFVLPSLRLRGENTELFLAGTREATGALDLQAAGTFDARILDSLVPQIEHATGLVEIKAAVTGTGERPVLVGSADVSRGAFRVRALPIQVQRLNGKLAFSQNQVVVEQATLQVNQGRGRVRGTVSLRDWAPDRFDLSFQGERMGWRMPADWPAVVSGRLHLGGAWPNELLLTGELEVDRLRYARDLDLERMVLDLRQRVRQPPRPDDVERMRLDVDLVGGSDMRIDNNLVRARLQFVAPPGGGKPRLKLVGTNVRMGLLGSVEVLDGIANFRGNEYRITHGVVEFDSRTRIDPEFDFTADTNVREYLVTVHAFGRLGEEGDESAFQLELSSDPTLVQADILTLLTFGITSKDLDRGGNAYTGAGVAAEALLTVSGLDEQLKRWLPETELFRDPEFSVTSQYSEVTGQVEPMATFEAKVISDAFRLKAAAPFSSAKGRRASAEYRFNERLSSQVVWENEETGYSAGDLGVDLKLRWEWE